MYKVTFYVPETHLENVKKAMFSAGAGTIGNYEQCAWQVKGQGQFKSLSGSNPFLGEIDKLEYVDEYRVEMVVENSKIKWVIQALKESHPYETPAFDVLQLVEYFDG